MEIKSSRFSSHLVYFGLGYWVSPSKVLISPSLVFSEVLLSRMMTKNLSGSFPVDRDVSITNLAIKLLRIPPGIYTKVLVHSMALKYASFIILHERVTFRLQSVPWGFVMKRPRCPRGRALLSCVASSFSEKGSELLG